MAIVDEIKQLKELKDSEIITQEDFYLKKAQILKQKASLDDLSGLKALLDEGVITEEEYFAKKNEALNAPIVAASSNTTATAGASDKQKIVAGLLAIFLGTLGIHKFYLGYQKEGIIMLCCSIGGWVLSLLIIGLFVVAAIGIIALIEGIMYLTKTDEQFQEMYVINKKAWF